MTSRIGVVLRTLTAFPDVSVDFRGLSKISSYAGGLQLKLKTLKVEKKKPNHFLPNLCKIFRAWQRNDAYSKDRRILVLYTLTVIR